jgi:YbbR domain-containing protein
MGGLQDRSKPFGEEKSVLLLERNNNNNNTTTINSHIGHYTLTVGGTNVKVQNYGHEK